jgi:prepilin-type N-terminal cleavage/methylation domain-containing protein
MKSRAPYSRFFGNAGFTLLEVMVSAALIAVVMTIMLMATTTSMAVWRNSERSIAVDSEGRNAVALLSDDFASMLAIPENAPDHLQPQIAVWKDLVFAEFFVLRPGDYQAPGANNKGDLCYVRYRYRDNKIERAVADSSATYEALREQRRPETPVYELVAANMPGFRVAAYDELGRDLDPEGDPTDISRARFAALSLDTIDYDEARNRERGINLRDRGTGFGTLSSLQYFSTFFEVPRP